ncbi:MULTISPECIES: GntR family transcriptional regulator [unclassified Streptomyces]|uniref:GntR family transcriptional regulator n=1 Tax=unclassified Streptomyces TaxID=2593676 RepID=UPI0013719200|nr:MULTISPECIES: GntR family transcriptional regulator [unclassified Streptomyces]MCW5251391.1 GntR family transcriptional regulator [Streptomyces sp. SHP 1-2]MYU22539.1 GntR family transcriptional regulator [Streptomyces sp. SID8352]
MSTPRLTRHAAPLRQQITRLLREDILSGAHQPGDALRESALCEAYGVSRTVVREALRQLETERLVTVVAHHGPVVTVLTPQDIEKIYEVRRALEGLVGELFAVHAPERARTALRELLAGMDVSYLRGTVRTREEANERFYGLLLEGAGNPVLTEEVARIHARVQIFRRYAFTDARRARISFEHFGRITRAAAVDRDPAEARAACEDHVRGAAALAAEEHRRRTA